MGQYGSKGTYSGYDKKNKEREALDYYSTPTEEVTNILNRLNIDFNGQTILEPSAGGGHMLKGILDYKGSKGAIIKASDIKERGNVSGLKINNGIEYDFLSDNYPFTTGIDYIIMNPPYSVIEPFVLKSLEIAQKKVILLGRLQFLEAESRFNKIFSILKPTEVYVYVDRIACYKNGDVSEKISSAQAYAWFVFEKGVNGPTITDWIRRIDKY